MIRPSRTSLGLWSQAFVALALIAMCVRGLIPAGYMLASPAAGQPLAIVMCTAQGAVTLAPGADAPHDEQAPEANKAKDAPCAFAGLGAVVEPPLALQVERVTFVSFEPVAPPAPPAVSPGRGLAAPPLPARGPPSLTA